MSDRNLVKAAGTEVSSMAKQGLSHPSSKPVLAGAVIGALAGAILPIPFIGWFGGLLIGTFFALYQRIR